MFWSKMLSSAKIGVKFFGMANPNQNSLADPNQNPCHTTFKYHFPIPLNFNQKNVKYRYDTGK